MDASGRLRYVGSANGRLGVVEQAARGAAVAHAGCEGPPRGLGGACYASALTRESRLFRQDWRVGALARAWIAGGPAQARCAT